MHVFFLKKKHFMLYSFHSCVFRQKDNWIPTLHVRTATYSMLTSDFFRPYSFHKMIRECQLTQHVHLTQLLK